MLVSLEDCLPTPMDSCHVALKNTIQDLEALGAPEQFVTEVSFLIRRLWTFAIAVNKPFAMMFGAPTIPAKIIMAKLGEDGSPLISQADVPMGGLFAVMMFQNAIKQEDAVYCSKLQSLIFQ